MISPNRYGCRYWLFALLLGCSSKVDCLPIGCRAGLEVAVESGGALPEGTYETEVSFGPKSVSCSLVLGQAAGISGECDDATVELIYDRVLSPGLLLRIGDTPASVDTLLRHDGEVMADETLLPTYQTSFDPDACTPRCTRGTAALRLMP
jgi:hypothetical protein